MSILVGQIITWEEFSTECIGHIRDACCNIGSYSSDVPNRLKDPSVSGSTFVNSTWIASITVSKTGGNHGWNGAPRTYNWYASSANYIPLVSASTVNTEWNQFLKDSKIHNSAGNSGRTDMVMTATDLTKAISLYMQFMSYHIKPVTSNLEVFNKIGEYASFKGNKYVSGSFTPSSLPDTPNLDPTNQYLTNIIGANIDAGKLLSRYSNFTIPTNTLV